MQHNKVGEQNLLNRFGLSSFFLIALTLSSTLYAQSFADFKRTQTSAFENYKEENDRIFVQKLKSEWEAYLLGESLSAYEEPKPREIFPARSVVEKKIGPRMSIKVDDTPKASEDEVTLIKILEPQNENADVQFDFYGTQISFNTPQGMKLAKYFPQNQKGISNFYNSVALSSYENLLKVIERYSTQLELNDWGKYQLVTQISQNIFSSQDESRLLSWFLFNKMGYAVKVALANNHVLVMYHSSKVIYSTPNYTIDKKKYYVLSNYAAGSAGKIFTYKDNYPEASKEFDLKMESLPMFNENLVQKTLEFEQYNKKYAINYTYNKNLIDFMATYPQADYETFFNTPLESKTYKDIALGLKKYINAKPASEALNFVLHFVQNAFKYEVDSKQFGREKVMFAQETLYYEKSDCEDRAILFSYLVKELFHIGVVGVKYKDHMATGLYIPMEGDSVKISSKKFVIADPTYVNASIGQSMPKYKNKRPESFIYLKQEKG